MAIRATPSRVALERARAQYDAGEPIAGIAASLGVTEGTVRRWRSAHEWPPREKLRRRRATGDAPAKAAPSPKAKPRRTPRKAGAASPDAETDIVAALARVLAAPTVPNLIEGLRVAVAGEMRAFLASAEGERGGEARTRVLANFARTLSLVRVLAEQAVAEDAGLRPDDDPDAPPVDVAELRAELARRLHRLTEGGNDP